MTRAGEIRLPPNLHPPESLYIHVPFCRKRCAYCDFLSSDLDPASGDLGRAFLRSTLSRAAALAERFGAGGFATVYVGGGTPTVLGPGLLRELLEGVGRIAGEPREWTVEANPESLDEETLRVIRNAGATRVSIGVQSLDDSILGTLGRIHDSPTALAAVERAAASGLAVSADLIAATPSETSRSRRRDLRNEVRRLLEAGCGHISIYDLTLEEGTALSRAAAEGRVGLADEDEALDERRRAEDLLSSRGFARYEISNYAPAGAESLHNLSYWRSRSYLGAGPGAVSTLVSAAGEEGAALRIEEGVDIRSYARGVPGSTETWIATGDAAFEAIMMGFRSVFGPDPEAFLARFGLRLEDAIPRSLGAWSERIVPGEPLPDGAGRGSRPGPALDGAGMDLLNRFLVGCLEEIEERRWPSGG